MTIEVHSIKDLVGQGREHTFILKILKILIIPFLTGNINACKKMGKSSKKKTKTRFCEQHLFCMTTWQKFAAGLVGHYILSSFRVCR